MKRTAIFFALLMGACSDGAEPVTEDNTESCTQGAPNPNLYQAWDASCASTVAYEGQVARHVLIKDLSAFMGAAGERIDTGAWFPAEGEVVGALNFYFRFDSETAGAESIALQTTPPPLQTAWEAFGSGKDLVGKIAGNDAVTDHKDWSTEFAGWQDASLASNGGDVSNPEGFVIALFSAFEKQAIDRANAVIPVDPSGQPLPLGVTADGRDLQQLAEKFLQVAVTFSQGADDYLDDDVPGKGLLSSNAAVEEGKTYTPLAHAWDEGFGYFGASRHYADFTDEELAGKGGREGYASGYADHNGDEKVDLHAEYSFGAAVNAAKRDHAAAELGAQIDLTGDAFTAFLEGRKLIASRTGELSEADLDALRAHRDAALLAWERTYMATVIHYINEVLAAMVAFGTPEYDFVEHAKAWSEAKGFAFAPQFSPHSPLSAADFAALHEALGDAPVLSTAASADVDAYAAGLIAVRERLVSVYGFPAQVTGDDDGKNGW